MKTILGITLAFIVSPAFAQAWLPITPPPGLHYRGPLVEHRAASFQESIHACASRIPDSAGCQWWEVLWSESGPKGYREHKRCHIIFYDEASRRHELAHCAGWRHDGQFGTPVPYIPGRDGNQGG